MSQAQTLDPVARRALEALAVNGMLSKEAAEKYGIRPQPSFDAYWRAAQDALAAICNPDYPAGMILWLERANPLVYAELTERLPDQIHRLWSEHAPLPKFQDVLDQWKQTHAQACVLYRAQLAAQNPGEANQHRLFCRRAVHGAG